MLVLVLTFSKKLKHIETEHRSDVEFRYIVYSQLVADIGKPVPARGTVEIHAYAYAAGDEQPEYALQIHCQVEAVGHQAAGATEFVVGDVGLVEEGEVYVRDELKPADIDAGGEQGTVSDINRDGIVG